MITVFGNLKNNEFKSPQLYQNLIHEMTTLLIYAFAHFVGE